MSIEESEKDGLILLRMENEYLEAEFLPQVGGKMIGLRSKMSGRQFLLPSQASDGKYRVPKYGDLYEYYDASGFDDCFPTIEPCQVQERNQRILRWPDHGEVWAMVWDYTILKNGILFSVQGREFNYELRRIVSLHQEKMTLRYQLRNRDAIGFHYIWAAHPLLNVVPGCRIFLPAEVKRVLVNWANPSNLGNFGEYLTWPVVNGEDFSLVKKLPSGVAFKGFTDRLNEGVVQIFFPDSNETLIIEFDPEKNPFLGIWITYGGWPNLSSRKHFTIGLEPSTGRPDSLLKAIARQECGYLESGQEVSWEVHFRIGNVEELNDAIQAKKNIQ